MHKAGNLFIISAPSGTGKTTLVKTLVAALNNITVSISHTTRPKRPNEEEGVNYFFVNKASFEKLIKQNDFLEYALVFNHLYGTSKRWVENTLNQGIDVILEIDWQGLKQIKKLFPHCISIFILPPSLSVLIKRLIERKQDSNEVINERVADAKGTILHIKEYDYIVLNDALPPAIYDLKMIISASRLLREQQLERLAPILAEFTN